MGSVERQDPGYSPNDEPRAPQAEADPLRPGRRMLRWGGTGAWRLRRFGRRNLARRSLRFGCGDELDAQGLRLAGAKRDVVDGREIPTCRDLDVVRSRVECVSEAEGRERDAALVDLER